MRETLIEPQSSDQKKFGIGSPGSGPVSNADELHPSTTKFAVVINNAV
jgi:hypothetical protein